MALPYLLATPLPAPAAAPAAAFNPLGGLFPPHYHVGQTVLVNVHDPASHRVIGQARGVITSVSTTAYGSPGYLVQIQGTNPLAAYVGNPPNPIPSDESDISSTS